MIVKSLVVRRAVRLALAALLIAGSAWAFSPFLFYRISSSAFVNAELMRVTAPIAGQLSPDMPPKGTFFAEPAKLILVKSHTSDRRRLFDLERQQTESTGRIKLATQQLAEVASLDRELQQRANVHRDGVIKRLTYEIGETTAEKKGCLAEAQQRRDISGRMKGLVQGGSVSEIKLAEAAAQHEAIATKCEMASARLERLRAELSSVEKGVFVRDSTNDVSYSQQQRERLVLRRQELETGLHQEQSRVAQLSREIEDERARVEQLGQYSATLPAGYVVWSMPASPGSAVVEGQTVLDLANCRHRFVAVELPEREFEAIRLGDAASIRLIGGTEWRAGRVRQVRGSAARGDDRLLAAQVPAAVAGHITVEVELPDDVGPSHAGFCGIGRLAEVRFERRAPAIIDRAEKLLVSTLKRWYPAQDKLASD